jgi:hypothetical protein
MSNPLHTIDPKGLQITPEIPPELLRDLPAELPGMAANKTMGAVTGVRCAQDYCKKKVIPRNKMTGPYAECLRIFTKFRLPAGVAPFTMSDEFVRECADECWKITRKKEFKEVCGICDKDE